MLVLEIISFKRLRFKAHKPAIKIKNKHTLIASFFFAKGKNSGGKEKPIPPDSFFHE